MTYACNPSTGEAETLRVKSLMAAWPVKCPFFIDILPFLGKQILMRTKLDLALDYVTLVCSNVKNLHGEQMPKAG